MKRAEHEILLTGLNGSTLLGFMAALGVAHALEDHNNSTRLGWTECGSAYVAKLRGVDADIDSLVSRLAPALSTRAGVRAFTINKDLKLSRDEFRKFCLDSLEQALSNGDEFNVEMAAAFGCDAVVNDAGNIQDTAFRTMGGAGHQHFLQFMNDLARETTPDHLREALEGPWRYRDPSPTMRWDSEDDRRYALRWDEPSTDPVRTVRGANRLAVEALSLFPVIPISADRAVTVAFSGRKSNDTFVRWPIWSGFLSLDAIRSLLGCAELKDSETSSNLAQRGVVAVYRSQRIFLGKFRSFTPAERI